MAQAAEKYYDPINTKPLLVVLDQLTDEYRKTKKMMGDQIHALVKNDLDSLNLLTRHQLERYDTLSGLETQFKNELDALYEQCDSSEKERTLTKFLRKLKGPNEELNKLRDTLKEQVDLTQNYKKQLTELLDFARDHNANTLRSVYGEMNQASTHYNVDGQRTSSLRSVAINRKA